MKGSLINYLWLVCVLLLLPVSNVYADTRLSKESKIKAAYLFNFTKYIEWPIDAFSEQTQSIHICLDELSPLMDFMRVLVDKRKVGKSKRLVKVVSFNENAICHLSYVDKNLTLWPENLMSSIVVTEEDFLNLNSPTMLFYQHKGKLRFEIFMQEVKKRKVTVSSELLKLALP